MNIEDFKIGQKVKVIRCEFPEWIGEEVTIVGMELTRQGNSEITVADMYGCRYDGFSPDNF